MATPEELKRIKEASARSAKKARGLLDDEISAVMEEVSRIGELKPQTADEETYKKLIEVVQEATAKNLSIAKLKENVTKLGEGAVALFKEIAEVAKTVK